MATGTKKERRMSCRKAMALGAVWNVSIGGMACVAFVVEWLDSGFTSALFWFGVVLMLGAGLFAIVLGIALLAEVLNITTRRSRRDALLYFGWAFVYNALVGGGSLLVALKLMD